MFTGIVEAIGRVTSAQPRNLVITASQVLQGMELGGSIAVNGVCLTITNFNSNSFSVDIMPETLRRTNLGLLCAGDEVNLERPLTPEKQLGGHLVQGHIDDMGRVTSVIWEGEAMLIRLEAPPEAMRYIVRQGFIAVDGVSLTIVDYDVSSFLVSIVDYTRKHTTLGSKQVGDLVNLEVDIIAKYLERLSQAHTPGITVDFLQEHGFLVG
ncbi:MAG: riboflavin synthase [Dehalococcoidia bacterium]|nr:MAG: riboflavin synthase [Dehalococcoidia bacterium]